MTHSGHHGHAGTMDPTFYRSPTDAIAAPTEELAYVVAFDRAGRKHDALTVVDTDPGSDAYGSIAGLAELPTVGDELHHFGWNACSSALKHEGHDMGEDDPAAGGLTLDQRFFPHGDDWRGLRPHQVRLQGGDASSDSYCYR